MHVWLVDTCRVQKSETPERLWWCPAGPFAFLPLHAARSADGNLATTHFVVSSYTPTLDMLITAQSSETKIADPNVVVVVQSEVKDLPKLDHAMDEYHRIRDAVPAEFMLNIDGTPLNPNDNTSGTKNAKIQDVLDRLNEASIVHFACHGVQDPVKPLDSALYLHDGKLTISKMQSIHRKLPASLAFLSACQSAKGHQIQPDEVIHLAAMMLSVGFQSVVATMWCVSTFIE
jgi:CHAT domain-containing protein